MKRQLCFSFVLSCEGVNPDLYHTDTNVLDVNCAATHAGIDTDYREGVDCVDKLEYREVWKESGFKRRAEWEAARLAHRVA